MAVEAIQRGAVNFLIKPIKKEKLFSAILSSLDTDMHLLPAQKLNSAIDSLSEREKMPLQQLLQAHRFSEKYVLNSTLLSP